MPKLVVKKHRPFEVILIALLCSGVFSIVVWLLLDASHWSVIKSRLHFAEKTHLLLDVNQSLEAENAILREQVVMFERSTQIDNQTAVRLQNDLRTLQDDLYQLKGELEFYQGIMSATTDSKGLNIQGIYIESTEYERIYRFKLVLTNVAKSDRVIAVKMDMSVEGMNEAGSQVLSLQEITSGSELKREIKFKNFQRIEGNLTFPVGFTPLRVVVDLQQKGYKRSRVHRVFEWPTNPG